MSALRPMTSCLPHDRKREIEEMYDGIRPEKPGYVPMQKQGSVILGIGGDHSDGDGGRFYEGSSLWGPRPPRPSKPYRSR